MESLVETVPNMQNMVCETFPDLWQRLLGSALSSGPEHVQLPSVQPRLKHPPRDLGRFPK
jgi:hypothetical protein